MNIIEVNEIIKTLTKEEKETILLVEKGVAVGEVEEKNLTRLVDEGLVQVLPFDNPRAGRSIYGLGLTEDGLKAHQIVYVEDQQMRREDSAVGEFNPLNEKAKDRIFGVLRGEKKFSADPYVVEGPGPEDISTSLKGGDPKENVKDVKIPADKDKNLAVKEPRTWSEKAGSKTPRPEGDEASKASVGVPETIRPNSKENILDPKAIKQGPASKNTD